MGMVAMVSRTLGRFRGYPIVEATLYVYCDRCGSFNIKKHITFRKWLMIMGIGCFVAVVVHADKSCLGCFVVLALLIVPLWRDILLSYKCRQCGYGHLSDYNALGYPSYDKRIVDVAGRCAQKRYIDEDAIGFGQFT